MAVRIDAGGRAGADHIAERTHEFARAATDIGTDLGSTARQRPGSTVFVFLRSHIARLMTLVVGAGRAALATPAIEPPDPAGRTATRRIVGCPIDRVGARSSEIRRRQTVERRYAPDIRYRKHRWGTEPGRRGDSAGGGLLLSRHITRGPWCALMLVGPRVVVRVFPPCQPVGRIEAARAIDAPSDRIRDLRNHVPHIAPVSRHTLVTQARKQPIDAGKHTIQTGKSTIEIRQETLTESGSGQSAVTESRQIGLRQGAPAARGILRRLHRG